MTRSTYDLDTILDDLFHGVAFAAFIEAAIDSGAMPNPVIAKYQAYSLYEQQLAVTRINSSLDDDPIAGIPAPVRSTPSV